MNGGEIRLLHFCILKNKRSAPILIVGAGLLLYNKENATAG